jgi:CxxC motif-containing protein (DUF1111 family)
VCSKSLKEEPIAMKYLKISVLFLFAAALISPMTFTSIVEGQAAVEAPRGFDNITNGFVTQAIFDADLLKFEERDGIDEGLGPCYNATACSDCHQNPVTGGISQITELRAGHFDGVNFINHPGGSLINDRATDAEIQERVLGGNEVRTFRTSLNVLGDGFIECIDSNVIANNANAQPAAQRGTIITVPVAEANNALRVGRFGWKNQQASLLSFSSDAYLNEMGITNRFNLTENTSNGRFVGFGSGFDPVSDAAPNGEDTANDIDAFTRFMRATKVPPRGTGAEDGTNGAPNADVVAGSNLFNQVGCNICHTRTFTSAPAGTSINGGAFTVPAALGNKTIHPFSDFALHDVGTGDGIVQNGGQGTRNQLRTPPLWGVRTRDRIMHDGEGLNRNESILRHAGQATAIINNYNALSATQKNQLIAFLNSL